MARVTVEDCIDKVTNRFELVLLAGQRAREIAGGAPLTIDRDRDKDPVVALREIADETVGVEDLRESRIRGLQRLVERDEPEDEPEDEMDPSARLAAALAEGGGEIDKVFAGMVRKDAEDGLDMGDANFEDVDARD